jgi:hypothetical protein
MVRFEFDPISFQMCPGQIATTGAIWSRMSYARAAPLQTHTRGGRDEREARGMFLQTCIRERSELAKSRARRRE